MPTLEALFAEICAHPTDMEPRREYAKLVGGERGRLIDVQLQSDAQLKAGDIRLGVGALLKQGTAEYSTRLATWAAPLAPEAKPLSFIRGFIEHVAVDAAWFNDNYQSLYHTAPVRHLSIKNISSDELARNVLACQGLSQITALYYTEEASERFIEALTRSNTAHNIKYVYCSNSNFSDRNLNALLTHLPSLVCFVSTDFEQEYQRDWNGQILFAASPPRLATFESQFGYTAPLHQDLGPLDPHQF